MPRTVANKSMFLRCGGLAAALAFASACHHEQPATQTSAPVKPPPVTAATLAAPVRAKPDLGGMGSEHIEATATGSTLEAAVDKAIRLAVEQVNGKSVDGGSAQLSSISLTANGQRLALGSDEYADWLATRTSGVVTHFSIVSQEQINHPVSTDEQNLTASQGESWNRGKFEASNKANADVNVRDDDAHVSASASEKASSSGEWDQHQGASNVDYKQKHTQFVSEWQVKVAADIAKYHEAASAKLTRVVIAMPRMTQGTYRVGDNAIAAEEIAVQIRTELTDALTQTHRFTVLDRDANEEIGQEIELIQSGNAKREDTARLGQQLATDLIVIPTIDRFEYLRHERALRLSDRTLASYAGGGALSFRVVNAVTGQIVLSQTFGYELPDTAPTTLGTSVDGPRLASTMMQSLDRKIVGAIMQSTFPLSVLQRDGRNLVINQGGEAVVVGTTYQAVTIGKELMDPQSGLSLGPTDTPCCTVTIDRVTPTLSYGHIVEANVDTGGPFVPGSMELREEVSAVSHASPNAMVARKEASKSAMKPMATKDKTGDDANW
jgi:curli biogenesis system outer membrane secretion channel CsgG